MIQTQRFKVWRGASEENVKECRQEMVHELTVGTRLNNGKTSLASKLVSDTDVVFVYVLCLLLKKKRREKSVSSEFLVLAYG